MRDYHGIISDADSGKHTVQSISKGKYYVAEALGKGHGLFRIRDYAQIWCDYKNGITSIDIVKERLANYSHKTDF